MTSTAPGWYPNGDQWETYWDGTQWTDQHRPVQPAGMPAPPLMWDLNFSSAPSSLYADAPEGSAIAATLDGGETARTPTLRSTPTESSGRWRGAYLAGR